jgi:GNAT superfamily N-acetyltransferase
VGGDVVGELLCHAIALPSGVGGEVLLYAIGVRSRWRRHGIGSLLMRQLDAWMDELGSTYVWVLADNPEAVQFYTACGFQPDPEGVGVVMMSRDRSMGQR